MSSRFSRSLWFGAATAVLVACGLVGTALAGGQPHKQPTRAPAATTVQSFSDPMCMGGDVGTACIRVEGNLLIGDASVTDAVEIPNMQICPVGAGQCQGGNDSTHVEVSDAVLPRGQSYYADLHTTNKDGSFSNVQSPPVFFG